MRQAGGVLVVCALVGAAACNGGRGVTGSDAGVADAGADAMVGPRGTIWAVSAGSSGGDGVTGVALDSQGGVIVAGEFSGTAHFGEHQLRSAGHFDAFVARIGPSGAFRWVTGGGSYEGHDSAFGVALDTAGNSYVVGYYTGTATLFGTTLVSKGDDDTFVAKLDAKGKRVWLATIGGADLDWPELSGVMLDDRGDVLVTGDFRSKISVGSRVLHPNGSTDVFVVKYSPDGQLVWATRVGGPLSDYPGGMATTSSGDTLLVGLFMGSARFGTTTLVPQGVFDIFLARLDKSGAFTSAMSFGGPDFDSVVDIALDASDNAYICGVFDGSLPLGTNTLSSVGLSDAFVAKLDASGNVLWADSAGTAKSDHAYTLAIGPDGNLYVAIWFHGIVTLCGKKLDASKQAFAVAAYSPSGECLGLIAPIGAADLYDMVIAPNGEITVVGHHSGVNLGAVQLQQRGFGDVFVWRFSSSAIVD